MMATKIVIGVSAFVLACTPLRCLHELSFSMKYHPLGEFYSSGMGCSLPVSSEFFLSAAPVGDWSYLAALFLAWGIGWRISCKIKPHHLLAIFIGSLAIHSATFAAIMPFPLASNYLGYPVVKMYSRSEVLTNIAMLVAAFVYALWPLVRRFWDKRFPNHC